MLFPHSSIESLNARRTLMSVRSSKWPQNRPFWKNRYCYFSINSATEGAGTLFIWLPCRLKVVSIKFSHFICKHSDHLSSCWWWRSLPRGDSRLNFCRHGLPWYLEGIWQRFPKMGCRWPTVFKTAWFSICSDRHIRRAWLWWGAPSW